MLWKKGGLYIVAQVWKIEKSILDPHFEKFVLYSIFAKNLKSCE